MKKIIVGLALSLGLVMPLSPAIASTPDPNAPSANVQCQGATNQICDELFGWARLVSQIEETIAHQEQVIQAQQATIAKQHATIKRLRAKLSRAH